jgi:hypothetical protein
MAVTTDDGLPSTFPKTWCPRCAKRWTTGGALQDLLIEAGPRYVKALKRARMSASRREKK